MKIDADIVPASELRASARPENLQIGMTSLKDFAVLTDRLDAALGGLAETSDKGAARAARKLRTQLAEFEPAVTILGQVKSGKTTLVNAMAGWPDLLPSDVNPWTSVVTSLHLTPGRNRTETSARFQFMSEDEWDRLLTKGGRMGELAGRAGADSELEKLRVQVESIRAKSRERLGRNFELLMGQKHEYGYFDKNLLERYICLGDDFELDGEPQGDITEEQGRFADITRSADLYLNSETIPFRMCLRDTPGVNDTFMMREQTTIQAIRDSRICVVVLSAGQALTSVDMGLIRLISNLKSREVIIFVNRIDELPDPARQIADIETSIRQTLKDHHGPTEAEIIFGSAYWAHKVLTGEIADMDRKTSDVLLGWAASRLKSGGKDQSVPAMVWELSGVPAVLNAISERSVASLGTPLVSEISDSATTLATGQLAARQVRVEGTQTETSLTPEQIWVEFNRIEQDSLEALHFELSTLTDDYHLRADRAHATFVNRATHSLIQHLERWGEQLVWEYDPSGLRILLRSAYSLFVSRTQTAAKKNYETAVTNIAELLFRGFGPIVEGIQISIPETPDAPSPIVLGQTIALDFNDGWWINWWRKRRGYKAFAEQFQTLITGETEQFMQQIKSDQPAEIHEAILAKLKAEFDAYRSILTDLIQNADQAKTLQHTLGDEEERQQRETLETVVATLQELRP